MIGPFRRVWSLALHRAWRTARVIPIGVDALRIQKLTDAIDFRQNDPWFAALHEQLSEFIVYYCDGAETFARIRRRLTRKFAALNPHQGGDYDESAPIVRGKTWVAPLAEGKRLRLVSIAICASGVEQTDMLTLFHELTHPIVFLDACRNDLLALHDKAIVSFANGAEMNIRGVVTPRDPSLSRDEWIADILCECEGHVWWDNYRNKP